MNKLHIELENCYGIKALKANLDFTQHKAYAIYAPILDMSDEHLRKLYTDVLSLK